MYEGYAPGGVAILIECLTDNRNRAAAEVRTALSRNGGNLADPGSVAYIFNRKGVVIVPKGSRSPRTTSSRSCWRPAPKRSTTTATPSRSSRRPRTCHRAQGASGRGIDYDSAEASFVPNLQVPLDLDGAKRMIRVIDALEDSDDVQNVFANGDISDEVLAQLDASSNRLGVEPRVLIAPSVGRGR
jgi:transcriptional/translational regulatory protein YebC/TACO1